MERILLPVFTTILTLISLFSAQAQEPLLDVLSSEIEYTFERLQGTDSPPYYIDFRVTDTRRRAVNASFGVLTGSVDNHDRIFKPQIRLGTPDFDNFRGAPRTPFESVFDSRLPLGDESPDAIRQIVWRKVEKDYRNAVADIERFRAEERVRTARDDSAPDWSPATVETYYEDPLSEAETAFDEAEMTRRAKLYSAVFRDTPELLNGTASIEYTTQRRYFVSSEGASVAQNSRACRLMINAMVRTDDGMDLPLHKSWFAFSPEGLPSDAEVLAETRRLVATLTTMGSAPVVTPYSGPVLLSGEAAGVFFHEIFGHRIEGQRMKSDSDGQTFKKMVGESVLPQHFSVYDDPTLANFGNTDMSGYYLYDDQGVRARRVDVVTDGVLGEFLMTRTPIDGFDSSNGHARAVANANPVSRQSNLVVETSHPLTDEQLREALITEAKAQQCEFGLYIKEVTGGFTQTGRIQPNSFNVTPLEVYKIYVDGRPDELVRGVDLIGTPLSIFSNIVEAGGEAGIFTGFCGAESGTIPVSAVSPQILVKKMEVQRKAKTSNLLPILDRPEVLPLSENRARSRDEIIFGAMKTELDRSMNELKMDGGGAPFQMSYIYMDERYMYIDAALGAIALSQIDSRAYNSVRLLTGDSTMTSELSYLGNNSNIPQSSAVEVDEWMIRREFWNNSDSRYKQAVSDMVKKLALRRQNVRTQEDAALPDLLPVEPVEKIVEGAKFGFDRKEWERRTEEISAVFAEYPSLYASRVGLSVYDRKGYILTSDGVKVRQPFSIAYLSINTSVRTPDGEELTMWDYIYAPSDLALPSQDSLLSFVRNFARRMSDLALAPKFENYYMGPVLFMHKPALEAFRNNLLKPNAVIALREREDNDFNSRLTPDRFARRIGNRVIDSRISVTNHSTMRSWKGVPLTGWYEIDSDGVIPPDSLLLIENGMLRALLNGRIPAPGAPASTGSNRLNPIGGGEITFGTIEISASEGSSIAELERELIALAAADGLQSAYIVEDLGTWKIDVATGNKTLVRGANIRPVDISKLRRLAGVSRTREVRNLLLGIPVSMIYPSAILLENIEIGATEAGGNKPLPIVNPLERD